MARKHLWPLSVTSLLLFLLALFPDARAAAQSAWGINNVGELADGTYGNTRLLPVPMCRINSVAAIAGSDTNSLALASDGTVWAWGRNNVGQLGNGTLIARNAPVQVEGPGGVGYLTDVAAIAGGGNHSLALKSDGTAWAWGYNAFGQLGDGTKVDKSVPVQVMGLSGGAALAGGGYHSLAIFTPTATLSGTVTLAGCVNSIQPITFVFRPQDGSPAFARTIWIGADGSFGLPEIPRAGYTVHITGSKWLAKNLTADLSGGDLSGATALLRPGDINRDNMVTIQDLGLLADVFNTAPGDAKWNPNADLNCDNRVNITDLGLLADNFNRQGDP
jgi:hypothetical protein